MKMSGPLAVTAHFCASSSHPENGIKIGMISKVRFLNKLCGGGAGRDSGDFVYPASSLLVQYPAFGTETGGEGAARQEGYSEGLKTLVRIQISSLYISNTSFQPYELRVTCAE